MYNIDNRDFRRKIMNNTIKQLFERKSVRVYQDKPIEAKEKH